MKPSMRPIEEIQKQAEQEFFEANGYYPTVEQLVRMVDEEKEAIQREREEKWKKEKEK